MCEVTRTATRETTPTKAIQAPTMIAMVMSVFFKIGWASMALSRALLRASLDVVVEVRVRPFAIHLHRQMIRRAQARIRLERLLRARHVEAVDGLKPIAVLHSEHAEERVRLHPEEADPDHLAVLLLGDDARLAHEIGLVLEDLVDHAAIDVELGGADLLDPLRDRRIERARATRRRCCR